MKTISVKEIGIKLKELRKKVKEPTNRKVNILVDPAYFRAGKNYATDKWGSII